MALTFDTHEAIRKLRGKGYSEPQAEGAVELVQNATGALVTRDHFDARLHSELQVFRSDIDVRFAEQRADFSHVLLVQTGVVLAAVVAINGASVSVALLLADRLFQ